MQCAICGMYALRILCDFSWCFLFDLISDFILFQLTAQMSRFTFSSHRTASSKLISVILLTMFFLVLEYSSWCYGGVTDQSSSMDHSQLWCSQTGVHTNEWDLLKRNPSLCGAAQRPTPTGGRACVWGAAPVDYHFSGIWFQNRLWHQVGLIMRQAAGWPELSVLRVCAGYAVTMVSKCILPWL